MKRMLCGLSALVLAVGLAACSVVDGGQAMTIQKAELTRQEQALIELVGSATMPYLLDFTVDDTVQTLQINTYELQNAKWELVSGGGGQQLEEIGGRIALTFDNIGYGIRTAIENHGSSSYAIEPDVRFAGLSTTTSYLTDETPILYDREIPLVIQIHTTKQRVSSYSPEHGFFDPQTYADLGYEKVYAVTCLFSQKTVDELSQSATD